MKHIFKNLGVALLLLAATALQAQTGSISGTVFDKEAKEGLIGATVSLEGTDSGNFTDFDGHYILRDIPVGKYTISVSYVGYTPTRIVDVVVKAGEQTKIDILLASDAIMVDEVTVVEYRQTNTVEAVLLEVRKARQVVSGVSSQQIVKSMDNNAAQIMQRIPGVTIVDNRFVMVRGLSERYNNVMINNVVAPSTEVDKRTFSFDLVPANALDRLMVFKSGSADLPGDFAGGVMKLYTVDMNGGNHLKVSLGTAFRAGTTGGNFFQSEGSPTDFLGFDNGFRTLPSSFPTSRQMQNSARNAELRRTAAVQLPNNFQPIKGMASPDHSLGLSFGRVIPMGRMELSTVNQLNYSTSYQHYNREFYRYFEWVDQSQPIQERFRFEDKSYEKQNRVSLLSNWKLRMNERSFLTFRNLFNQIGENETILRNGYDFIQRPNDDLSNYLLGYRSRSIYTGQLEGNHEMAGSSKLRWVVGGSFLREAEPDLRRFRTFRPQGQSDQPFTMQLPPSSNLFETGRYYGDLMEYSVNQGLDLTTPIRIPGLKSATIKTGYYADYRARDFSSRYFSYLYPGFFDPTTGQELSRLPLDRIFAPENIRTKDGFVIEEGTRPIDSYTASNLLGAAYASADFTAGRFDVSTGLRSEYNVQQMNSRDDFSDIEVNNPVLSFLPFLNAGYNMTERSVVRFAYSRTVNRPEFRELAPFLFYDYKLEAGRFGNPDLRQATIENLDLRWEFYPRSGETFSLGGFYKFFNDPIENKTIITTEQPSFTFINADFARNFGAELEFRKSLNGLTSSAFLDHFSFNLNASLIWSEVDLGSSAVAQDRVRPLQGQSPYIVNLAVNYDDQEMGLAGSIAYNIFGNRIYSVGDVLFPTIYELSRNSLDVTLTKKVGSRSSLKLGVQNLLDAPFRFYQDSNRNEAIDGKDHPIVAFRRGQLVSVSFSYDISK